VGVDHVGSVPAAAKVIAVLHHGENRLVCDSRIEVEELSAALHGEGVETYVSRSSISPRRAPAGPRGVRRRQ
jgi:ATP-dependent helicase Lhr and Lhr-like helicase